MNKSISNNNVLHLLIGGFSLFLFIDISYSIALILRDSLIATGINHLFVFIIKELVQTLVFIFFILYGLKYLSNKTTSFKKLKSITIYLIIAFVATEAFQVLYMVYFDYLDVNIENYLNYMKANYFLYIIASFMACLPYIIFPLILFNYIRGDD